MINDNMAMCIVNQTCESLDLASIAEELLTFEDVDASFVIGKLSNDLIGISSRSLGNIDVSIIMNKLGGGGHSSNAAAQIKDKSLKEVKQEIIDLIKAI